MKLSVDLQRIAREANDAHGQVVDSLRRSLEHARRAGELLNQAKAAVPHGQWSAWLGEHFKGSGRNAQHYMKLDRHWPKLEKRNAVSDLPIREAIKLLTKPRKVIVPGAKVIDHPSVVFKRQSEPEETTYRTMEFEAPEPGDAAIRRSESMYRQSRAYADAARSEVLTKTGPVAYVEALLMYSDTRSPADLADALEPFSEITASDIERLIAWLSDAAIALDRKRELPVAQ